MSRASRVSLDCKNQTMVSHYENPNSCTEPGREASGPTFETCNRLESSADVSTDPDGTWVPLLESACSFPPNIFNDIMLNLIKNPNITSSHLFRADILYDTGDFPDGISNGESCPTPQDALLSQLRSECRPRAVNVVGMRLQRTIVRELVPRNPNLDRPLIQTCHLFHAETPVQCNVVVYVPHVDEPEDMPFYHPAVRRLAFSHVWQDTDADRHGRISVSYDIFPTTDSSNLPTKLQRTALRLLQTVHKHGQGRLAGYQKRVHLDRIVPQKRSQDTYTRLKTTHGRRLVEAWVEVTDPGKHVFEDLAIAAFLIELWRDMYQLPPLAAAGLHTNETRSENNDANLPAFPGFIDIGCGNGLLVAILTAEGYPGWGFDARARKTWSTLGPEVRERLQQCVLVPAILQRALSHDPSQRDEPLATLTVDADRCTQRHDGTFPRGTFIISNHADELTAWTPLLAAMNGSAFVAIPCCSHDLSGARFRAPPTCKRCREADASVVTTRLPQQQQTPSTRGGQAAEMGSLAHTVGQKKMPSAYATLCSYVVSLAEEMGFVAETEALRIPSTRNESIIGRTRRKDLPMDENGNDSADQTAVELIERELSQSIVIVAKSWIERAQRLAEKPASGH